MNATIVLITGSTDGIGKQTAIELIRMGATVIIHGRNEERCQETVKEIKRNTSQISPDFVAGDLSNVASVMKLAEAVQSKYPRLDVLINNAGVYMKKRIITEDGFEMTFAVNHLAPFLLTQLLLGSLQAGAHSRIINVSSMAHQRGMIDYSNLQGEKHFDGYAAYALSKLANILFTNGLAHRLIGKGVTVNALHPGVIDTKLLREGFSNLGGGSVLAGAETSVYLASSPEVAEITGKYFVDKKVRAPAAIAADSRTIEEFWEVSKRLIDSIFTIS